MKPMDSVANGNSSSGGVSTVTPELHERQTGRRIGCQALLSSHPQIMVDLLHRNKIGNNHPDWKIISHIASSLWGWWEIWCYYKIFPADDAIRHSSKQPFPVTFILLLITGEAEAYSGLFQSSSQHPEKEKKHLMSFCGLEHTFIFWSS